MVFLIGSSVSIEEDQSLPSTHEEGWKPPGQVIRALQSEYRWTHTRGLVFNSSAIHLSELCNDNRASGGNKERPGDGLTSQRYQDLNHLKAQTNVLQSN